MGDPTRSKQQKNYLTLTEALKKVQFRLVWVIEEDHWEVRGLAEKCKGLRVSEIFH